MKSTLLLLCRSFCILSGLILAPTLLAVVLSYAMGLLPPLERVKEALASVRAPLSAEELSEEPNDPVPNDGPLWQKRLHLLQREVAEKSDKLETMRLANVTLQERAENSLSAAANTFSALLGRKIEIKDILEEADALIAELKNIDSEQERFPVLLSTVQAMTAKSAAKILASAGGDGNVVSLGQSVKLLRAMPPRKAAAVLEAMAKLAPEKASEILSEMGNANTSK